jgi:hypothetical protein
MGRRGFGDVYLTAMARRKKIGKRPADIDVNGVAHFPPP